MRGATHSGASRAAGCRTGLGCCSRSYEESAASIEHQTHCVIKVPTEREQKNIIDSDQCAPVAHIANRIGARLD